jgi:hypothetical protein
MPSFGITVFKVILSDGFIFKVIEYMMPKWQRRQIAGARRRGGPGHKVDPGQHLSFSSSVGRTIRTFHRGMFYVDPERDETPLRKLSRKPHFRRPTDEENDKCCPGSTLCPGPPRRLAPAICLLCHLGIMYSMTLKINPSLNITLKTVMPKDGIERA